MKKLLAILAALALTACSGMTSSGGSAVSLRLTGAEEVPPVSVPGSGTGSFTIGEDGAVRGSVTTTGVQGTMAHIHLGARGKNGPVIIPLVKNGDSYAAPQGAKLTDAQLQAFRAGDLYVNVHTAQNKGGEVRAQLRP